MKRYIIHSPFEWEEVKKRAEQSTRPWSRADLWTARNTDFHRDGPKEILSLMHTGPARGYLQADLKSRPSDQGGTLVSVTAGLPKTLVALDACMWVFYILFLVEGYMLGEIGATLIRGLCTLWAPIFLQLFTWKLKKSQGELDALVKQILVG